MPIDLLLSAADAIKFNARPPGGLPQSYRRAHYNKIVPEILSQSEQK